MDTLPWLNKQRYFLDEGTKIEFKRLWCVLTVMGSWYWQVSRQLKLEYPPCFYWLNLDFFPKGSNLGQTHDCSRRHWNCKIKTQNLIFRGKRLSNCHVIVFLHAHTYLLLLALFLFVYLFIYLFASVYIYLAI